MTTRESPSPGRRTDLDGLRGLAVLLVLGFHAGFALLRGAFVAVDVFFVLSGFFLATALSQRLVTGDAIRPTEVLARRVWRLLPTLALVLLATLASALLLYAPIDRAAVARHAIPVAFFAGNLAFASDGVNYFAAAENPLLHTWTLGVEVQLALVLPLLMLLAVRRAKGAETESERRYAVMRSVLLTVGIAGAISLGLSIASSGSNPMWAYFGPHTRLWAFCAGAALALLAGGGQSLLGASTIRIGLVQAAGLTAIFVPALLFDRGMPYPGVLGLMPVAGTLGLLAGGGLGAATLPGRLLAIRPLAWAGKYAYPWYLWHLPLMVLGSVLLPETGHWGRFVWGLAGLPLAVATQRWVERPLGGLAPKLTRPLLTAAVVCAALALAALWVASSSSSYVGRSVHRRFAQARGDRMEHDCWAGGSAEVKRDGCAFGDPASGTSIALLGDSHAEHWLGGLERAGAARGWRIETHVMGACPVSDFSRLSSGSVTRMYRNCSRYREAVLQRLETQRPAAVILSNFDYYIETGDGEMSEFRVGERTWTEGLRRTYARLTRAGIRVIVMRGTPLIPFNVPSCLSRKAAGLLLATDCSYRLDRKFVERARRAQDRAAEGLHVRFVDMNDQICPLTARRCDTERGGVVMFTDDNHLTASFSRTLAPILGERLETALRR